MENALKHMRATKAADYVTGRIQAAEREELEKHIAGCEECTRRVEAHRYIRDNFDKVWHLWTAISRDPAVPFMQISDSLAQVIAQESYAGLRPRLESWLKRVRSCAGIAWCAAIGPAGEVFRVVSENIEELRRLAPDPVSQPVALPAALRTEGVVHTSSKGMDVQPTTSIPLQSTLSVESAKGPGGYSVRVKSPLLKEPLPLVILMPETGGEPMVRDFRKIHNRLEADFKDLLDGRYLVVVEGGASENG
jgi:hypothetical protein